MDIMKLGQQFDMFSQKRVAYLIQQSPYYHISHIIIIIVFFCFVLMLQARTHMHTVETIGMGGIDCNTLQKKGMATGSSRLFIFFSFPVPSADIKLCPLLLFYYFHERCFFGNHLATSGSMGVSMVAREISLPHRVQMKKIQRNWYHTLTHTYASNQRLLGSVG